MSNSVGGMVLAISRTGDSAGFVPRKAHQGETLPRFPPQCNGGVSTSALLLAGGETGISARANPIPGGAEGLSFVSNEPPDRRIGRLVAVPPTPSPLEDFFPGRLIFKWPRSQNGRRQNPRRRTGGNAILIWSGSFCRPLKSPEILKK